MTGCTSIPKAGTRRHPVSGDRVICWRLGQATIERCFECVYLVRVEGAIPGVPVAEHVVCTDLEPEVEFAW